MLKKIWHTLRPKHWIKNSFIFAPALFADRLLDTSIWLPLVSGALGFSLVASSIYAFNDVCNRSEDRLHPVKQFRPVASGDLSVNLALTLTIISFSAGSVLLFSTGIMPLIFAGVYAFLMTAYTLALRRVLLIDVIIIATGFVLRIKVGGVIIDEPISHWLLLCTFTIALLLAMVKRRQEIMTLVSSSDSSIKNSSVTRAVLDEYPPVSVLDGWINVLTGMTVLCYALYTVDPQTIAKHNTTSLIYTLPFVLYGVFRYQKLALADEAGEDPTGLILKDAGMKIVLLLWALTVSGILYWNG